MKRLWRVYLLYPVLRALLRVYDEAIGIRLARFMVHRHRDAPCPIPAPDLAAAMRVPLFHYTARGLRHTMTPCQAIEWERYYR